jgi:hypothetical protein
MYPMGTLVRVVGNTNNHWFAIGEDIIVGKPHPYDKYYPSTFRGEFTYGEVEEKRYRSGGGPWVKSEDVILVDPELSLEKMLKECLE